MSVKNYPLHDIGLDVTPEGIIPYVMLAYDIKNGNVPPEIQEILDRGIFSRSAADKDDRLEHNGYFDIFCVDQALESLGIEAVFCYSFDGNIAPIDPATLEPDMSKTRRCSDDTIIYIPAKNALSPFKAAYGSFGAIITEMKETLTSANLPEDFDLAPYVVSIEGVYFC